MQNNPSILVLDKNKNSREVIKGYLEDSGFAANIELFEDYSAGYENLKTLDNNSIVIMDITSEHDDIIKDTTEKIRLYTSKLIICSSDYSTNTIVKALRIGAKEFLPKPIIKEDLLRKSTDAQAKNIVVEFDNAVEAAKNKKAAKIAEFIGDENVKSAFEKIKKLFPKEGKGKTAAIWGAFGASLGLIAGLVINGTRKQS